MRNANDLYEKVYFSDKRRYLQWHHHTFRGCSQSKHSHPTKLTFIDERRTQKHRKKHTQHNAMMIWLNPNVEHFWRPPNNLSIYLFCFSTVRNHISETATFNHLKMALTAHLNYSNSIKSRWNFFIQYTAVRSRCRPARVLITLRSAPIKTCPWWRCLQLFF